MNKPSAAWCLGRGWIVLGLLTLLAGCTDSTDDIHPWIAEQKAKKGAPIPPLPVIKTFESYIYQDQSLRDPFSLSPSEVTVGNGLKPPVERARQPLEDFALDSLQMVGTMGSGTSLEALIRDPSGVIHRVHRNEYLGQNYGRITVVAGDRVDLVELVPDGKGGWLERPASIALGELKTP